MINTAKTADVFLTLPFKNPLFLLQLVSTESSNCDNLAFSASFSYKIYSF